MIPAATHYVQLTNNPSSDSYIFITLKPPIMEITKKSYTCYSTTMRDGFLVICSLSDKVLDACWLLQKIADRLLWQLF